MVTARTKGDRRGLGTEALSEYVREVQARTRVSHPWLRASQSRSTFCHHVGHTAHMSFRKKHGFFSVTDTAGER